MFREGMEIGPEKKAFRSFGRKNLDFRENPRIQSMENGLRKDLVESMEREQARLDARISPSDRLRLERAKSRKKEKTEEFLSGKILEAGIKYEIERGKLFGPKAEAYKTSEYDDRLNGTDLIMKSAVNSNGREQEVRLGIDVTLSGEPRVIREKKDKIVNDIQTKKRHFALKYSPFGDSGPNADKHANFPRVVIAIDAATYSQVLEKWHEGGNNDEFRIVVLEEARAQLRGEMYHIFVNLFKRTRNQDVKASMADIRMQTLDDEVVNRVERVLNLPDQRLKSENQDYFELLNNTLNAFHLVKTVQKEKQDSVGRYDEVLQKHLDNDKTFQQVIESDEPNDDVARLM